MSRFRSKCIFIRGFFFRDKDPRDNIGKEPDSPGKQGQYCPNQPYDGRIDIQVIANPPAYTAKHAPGFRAIQPFHGNRFGSLLIKID